MAMVLNRKRTRAHEKEPHGFSEVRDLRGVAAAVVDMTLEDGIGGVGDEYGDNMGCHSGKDWGKGYRDGDGKGGGGVGGDGLVKEKVGLVKEKVETLEVEGYGEEEERKRRLKMTRLTPSKLERVEKWVDNAARSAEQLHEGDGKMNGDYSMVNGVSHGKGEVSMPLKSQWPGKEEREPFWTDSLMSRSKRREGDTEGDLASNATSTRALATATAKPSFDTEVSPRSAPPSPAPAPGWNTALPSFQQSSKQEGNENVVVRDSYVARSSSKSIKSIELEGIVEARKKSMEESESSHSGSRKALNRIDSGSVMNRELSATIERFHSFGGGLHTSFTARSGVRSQTNSPTKRARPPAMDVDDDMLAVTSKPFSSSTWNEFDMFMVRGLTAMSKRRMSLFERMLGAIKSISIMAEVLTPPSIPASLSVLTDEVEKSASRVSPAVNDLFNRKINLLKDHLQALLSALRGRQKQSVASDKKPPIPKRIKSVKGGRQLSNQASEVIETGDTVMNESPIMSNVTEAEEAEEAPITSQQPTLAEGLVQSSRKFKRIRSGESTNNSLYHEYELDESQLYPLDLANQSSNPMRVTFISVKSYGNSEASSRSLNFVPNPIYRQAYSKYRRSSLSSIPSSRAMSLNSSFTRIDFVPQPPYDGARPSLLEKSAGKFYSNEPIYYRWKISRVIGRGSFSQVRIATSLRESFRGQIPGGLVAVKLVQKTATDLFTKDGICREVASYVQLSKNSTMANLLEVSEDANTVYIVIEHLGGGHLFNRIAYPEFYPKYNERDVAFFIRQLAMGLRDSHAANIIHRDVKPENVLFSKEYDVRDLGRCSQIVLMDYGISHIGVDPATEVLGTPLYMAPEVLLRKKYSTMADMWSLGVMAHLMLVGSAPFDEDNPEDLIHMIKFDEVNMCGEEWHLISDAARDFVARLLVKDPADRMSASDALRHAWLGADVVDDRGWPWLEVAQVGLQSINARNSLNERNRMEKVRSQVQIEQEQEEEYVGLYGKNMDLDSVEYDTDSGVVTRQLTSFANGKVGTHAITQPQRRQKARRWLGRGLPVIPPTSGAGGSEAMMIDDDASASTISVPQQDASAILASPMCIKHMKTCMVERRDADAGPSRDDGSKRSRKRRNRVIRSSRKKLSDEKLKKKRGTGLYSRLHSRLPSQS